MTVESGTKLQNWSNSSKGQSKGKSTWSNKGKGKSNNAKGKGKTTFLAQPMEIQEVELEEAHMD